MSGVARGVGALLGGSELPAGLSGLLQLLLALIAMIVASIPRQDWRAGLREPPPDDVVPLRYDVPALTAYFSRRPMVVLRRNAEVVSKLSGFCLAILADWRLGYWESNMPQRGVQIRQVRV
jgi:hypothetical protein